MIVNNRIVPVRDMIVKVKDKVIVFVVNNPFLEILRW